MAAASSADPTAPGPDEDLSKDGKGKVIVAVDLDEVLVSARFICASNRLMCI